jgi:hypothetical protein
VNAPSGFPVAGDLILGDEIAEEVVSSQLEAGDWWFGSVDEWLAVTTVLSKLSAYFNPIEIPNKG